MNKDIKEYIEDGIKIDKIDGGYSVFTVKTQRFTIETLDDLNKDTFISAIQKLKERNKLQEQLFKEIGKENKGPIVIDKLRDFCTPNMLGHEDYDVTSLENLLGPFETFDYDDDDYEKCIHYFEDYNVYIMVEGYNGSSGNYYYDSDFIEVAPTTITKKAFKEI